MFTKELCKRKVLFIMHFPPPVHGASMVGSYIKNSTLINENLDAEYINLATNSKLDESGKGSFKKMFIFFDIVKKVLKKIRQKHFDLCYISLTASGLGFYKDLIVVFVLKIYGNKIIYHFHNKGVAKASNNAIKRYLYRFAFRKTKSILLSPHLYQDISRYVKEKDVFYCPNGIPPIPSSFIKKSVNTSASRICSFLYLSNMMQEKGVYTLLDALKDLKDRQIQFECHFVGAWADITEQSFQEKIDENDLNGIVFAHGPTYGNDKYSFFKEADVFLFPTFYHYETFGLVNLEAMQYGLPIISTPEGGIPDVVIDGETGFLVPQRNSKELANKLEILVHHPELRLKMGLDGKKRYEDLFTLDKFERRFTNILEEVIHL